MYPICSNVSRFFTFQSGYIQIDFCHPLSMTILSLHSNLVIFKFEKTDGTSYNLSSLHSNLVIFKCYPGGLAAIGEAIFTFQSGYIQINTAPYTQEISVPFTFQSGYIQMIIVTYTISE